MTTEFKARKKIPWLAVVLLGGTAVLFAMVVWVVYQPEREQAAKEAAEAAQQEEDKRLEGKFLTECHADIKDQLRDPDSAKFESGYGVVVGEDGQYTVLEDARARNGFGGMNNFRIACTAYYDETADSFDVESEIID